MGCVYEKAENNAIGFDHRGTRISNKDKKLRAVAVIADRYCERRTV